MIANDIQKRKEDLSSALKKYREVHGFSQQELAHLIGTTIFTISRWECCKHYPPKSTIKLMTMLGVLELGSA